MLMKIRKTIKRKDNQRGFTLIELIVVMAILAVLAAIAVPKYTGVQDNAKKRADIASARTIVGAAQTAQAEGVAVVDGSDLTTTKLAGYLNSWPVGQVTEAALVLDETSGVFSVKDKNGVEIYPTAGDAYK